MATSFCDGNIVGKGDGEDSADGDDKLEADGDDDELGRDGQDQAGAELQSTSTMSPLFGTSTNCKKIKVSCLWNLFKLRLYESGFLSI